MGRECFSRPLHMGGVCLFVSLLTCCRCCSRAPAVGTIAPGNRTIFGAGGACGNPALLAINRWSAVGMQSICTCGFTIGRRSFSPSDAGETVGVLNSWVPGLPPAVTILASILPLVTGSASCTVGIPVFMRPRRPFRHLQAARRGSEEEQRPRE